MELMPALTPRPGPATPQTLPVPPPGQNPRPSRPPTPTDSCNSATVTQVGTDSTVDGTCAGTFSESCFLIAPRPPRSTLWPYTPLFPARDNTPPFISDAGANATIDCPASPTFTAPTACDSHNSTPVTQDGNNTTSDGTYAGTYSETRTCHPTDPSGTPTRTKPQTLPPPNTY